jgi:hypothetical protein
MPLGRISRLLLSIVKAIFRTREAAMDSGTDIALYGQGLFDTPDQEQNLEAVKLLANSGFTTLMLFALHVYPDGQVYWGPHPVARAGRIVYANNSALPQLVNELRTRGFRRIQFTIGSADAADWAHIQALLATPAGQDELRRNFDVIARWLRLDGFDLDCEEDVRPETITRMTELLAPMGQGMITWSVYDRVDWWLDCLRDVYTLAGRQLVQRLNLQAYGPGPAPDTWIKTITDYPHDIGISERAAFIDPGYDAGDGPDGIRRELVPLAAQGVTSAFVWQSGSIFTSGHTPSQYASAIAAALDHRAA